MPTSDFPDEPVATYAGPHPPAGQTHRYVFLLFAQPEGYSLPEEFEGFVPPDAPHRVNFDVLRFMEVAHLAEPVAATYFTVNEAVPWLRIQWAHLPGLLTGLGVGTMDRA